MLEGYPIAAAVFKVLPASRVAAHWEGLRLGRSQSLKTKQWLRDGCPIEVALPRTTWNGST